MCFLAKTDVLCAVFFDTAQISPVFGFMQNFSALVSLRFNKTSLFHKKCS